MTYRTNFPKEIMCFPGFPFSPQLPSFPHHSDVLSYLNQYAKRYNLHQFIHFECLVELIEPAHKTISPRKNGFHSHHLDVVCAEQKEEEDVGEFEDMVKWTVTVLNLKTGERLSKIFDLVLLCSG